MSVINPQSRKWKVVNVKDFESSILFAFGEDLNRHPVFFDRRSQHLAVFSDRLEPHESRSSNDIFRRFKHYVINPQRPKRVCGNGNG